MINTPNTALVTYCIFHLLPRRMAELTVVYMVCVWDNCTRYMQYIVVIPAQFKNGKEHEDKILDNVWQVWHRDVVKIDTPHIFEVIFCPYRVQVNFVSHPSEVTGKLVVYSTLSLISFKSMCNYGDTHGKGQKDKRSESLKVKFPITQIF